MKKMVMRLLFVMSLVLIQLGLYAQNEMEVASIRSPNLNELPLGDSANIEVTLENKGPNTILSFDTIYFTVKVSTIDTSLFYDVKKRPLGDILPNDAQIFTLLEDYVFDVASNFQICVSANSTNQYPINTSKAPPTCVAFAVSLGEHKLEANKLFYNNHQINFELSEVFPNTRIRVLDMSGKLLKSEFLKNQKQQKLLFDPPAKGLYFIQLQAENGLSSTHKFVVK